MTRPKDYKTVASNPGTVPATFSTSEIEGRRTIHLDCFVKGSSPYGHLTLGEAKRLLKFVGEAIIWMENEE